MTSSTRCILHWLSPFVGQLFIVSIAYDSTTEEVTAPYHSRFMKFNSLIASSKPEYLIDTGAKVSEVWVECS